MEYPIKKVVMTGGTSGIGLALIKKLLEHNIEVLILRRKTTTRTMQLPESELLHIDYCALEELESYAPKEQGYDVFFHLGWTYTSREDRNNVALQIENVRYACAAVELAQRLGCHSFIGTGSQAEYGSHEEVLTPQTLCNPENAYGIAKLSACYATRKICKQYGIRHIWSRILSGYGIYDNVHSVLMSAILNGMEGNYLWFSKGEQIWDFVYFDDIADALYLMAQSGRSEAIYTIGSGSARPLRQYLEIVCKKLGRSEDAEFGKIPYGANQITHLEASFADLQRDTGWKPHVDFETGIETVIDFIKTHTEYKNQCLKALYSIQDKRIGEKAI